MQDSELQVQSAPVESSTDEALKFKPLKKPPTRGPKNLPRLSSPTRATSFVFITGLSARIL
jgi:hypothetical protein